MHISSGAGQGSTVFTPKMCGYAVILLNLIIHLMIAPQVSLGVDEAHYALYARYPALSYFDHPPMVGWLQMLVAPLGYSEFTLRLVPSLIQAATGIQLLRLMTLLYPAGPFWQGFVALLLFSISPIIQLMGWGMVPDQPLMLIALLIMESVYRLEQNQRLTTWLILGLLFGLAGLSKYTAVLLVPAFMFYMLRQQGTGWLFSYKPWLAAIVALVVISPVLLWNYQHDWASFRYQLNHSRLGAWDWQHFLETQVFQMICYSILMYFAGIWFSVRAFQQGSGADWLGLSLAWPILVMVSWSAAHGEILPNWPAAGWVCLIPLTANRLSVAWRSFRVKVAVLGTGLLSAGLIVFLFLFLAFQPLASFPFMAPLFKDLAGWQQAAGRAAYWHQQFSSDGVILLDNTSHASRIAWYAYPLPVVMIDDSITQFNYWYDRSDSGILMRANEPRPEEDRLLTNGFDCRFLDQLDSKVDGIMINQFHFYRCEKNNHF